MSAPLNITPKQVAWKKVVGRLKSNPIFEIATTGGLYLAVLGKGASFEVLGTGPHRAVSRYIAEQKQPDIEWSDLNKADWVAYEDFVFLLPQYVALTEKMRAMQGV